MEFQRSDDQKKYAILRQRVDDLLAALPADISTQGSIVKSWRSYRGRRLGPYFRLAYRNGGRQRSLYLGADAELAAEVRQRLAQRQAAHRLSLMLHRQKQLVRKSLARHKNAWRRELAAVGLLLKGNEIRGLSRSAGRIDRSPAVPQ